jgi:hypothetical protein
MLIALINESTLVSNADCETICQAIQLQITKDFAPAWEQLPATITFYADKTKAPSKSWIISLIDNDEAVQGALGWHQEQGDKVEGFIVCEPILSNGGVIMAFDANNPGRYSVSGTLSHEIMETCGDYFTNLYADNGGISWCCEMCDCVEQIGYGIEVNGVSISVSDFVLPQFYNPQATAADGPFNFLKSLTKPFQILAGGYSIQRTNGPGTETQIFGEAMPEWRRETKRKSFSRGGRRIAK